MNTQIPFRARCSDQGDICTESKSPFQNRSNIETVTVEAPNLAPAPLVKDGDPAGTGCNCTPAPPGNVGSGINWSSAFCGGAELWQGAVQDMNTVNTFTPGGNIRLCLTGSPETSGCCHRYGFKKYAGMKQWHGTYGWIDNDACAQDTSIPPTQTKYRTMDYQFTAVLTRDDVWGPASAGYRHVTGGVSLKFNVTVDDLTGETKLNSWTSACNLSSSSSNYGVQAYAGTPPADSTNEYGYVFFNGLYNAPFSIAPLSWVPTHCSFTIPGLGTDTAANLQTLLNALAGNERGEGYDVTGDAYTYPRRTFTATNTVLTFAFTRLGSLSYSSGGNSETASSSMVVDWVVTLSDPYTAAEVQTDIEGNLLPVFKLNDPSPWRVDAWSSIMPMAQRREVQADVSPVQMFPSGSANDLRYPITDANGNAAFTTVNPSPPAGWTYNAGNVGGIDWVPTYTQMTWFDPASYFWAFPSGTLNPGYAGVPNAAASAAPILMMDGAIIGAPKPVGTYGYFDFYFRDKRYCDNGGGACNPQFVSYLYDTGGNLADCNISVSNSNYVSGPEYASFLPANSTHWSNNDMAHGIPRGALIDIGGVPGINGGIFEVKAAFVRLPVPSYNFFRPCGSDRVLIDEPSAQEATFDIAGVSVRLAAPIPDPTGQTVLVWKTTGSDGIWTGCTQATVGGVTTLTLGTKVCALPTDYFHAFDSQFATIGGLVGIVRFPGAWALCGRQQVTFADNGGGTTKITFVSPQTNLRVGDSLDFSDVNMASVIANIPVATRIDDSNFTASTTLSSFAGAVWAMSHGAPGYWWNDSSQKFECRIGSWDFSGRTNTTNFDGCIPDCIPFWSCGPQVIAFSPNAENWPSIQTPDGLKPMGKNYWFGAGGLATFTADGVFGSRVQANVEWEMPDPLYQTPACPSGYTCAEDDGTCAADSGSTIFSPPPPRVEARCNATPNNAGPTRSDTTPALPTDALGNTVTWPAMVQPPNPGVAGVSYNVVFEPWMRYMNEVNSINAGGCRWLNFYYSHTLGGDR